MRDWDRSLAEMYTDCVAEGTGKTAADLARYRIIIDAVQPTLIIETGTHRGGSALWFARNSDAEVVTVDIDVDRIPSVVHDALDRYDVTVLRGDSVEVADEIRHVWGDASSVLVSLDSAHDADTVYRELRAYAPFVTPGSYIVVEDTLIDRACGAYGPEQHGDSSPLLAVDWFLSDYGDEFVNDLLLEDMSPTTQHPGGWLRRSA